MSVILTGCAGVKKLQNKPCTAEYEIIYVGNEKSPELPEKLKYSHDGKNRSYKEEVFKDGHSRITLVDIKERNRYYLLPEEKKYDFSGVPEGGFFDGFDQVPKMPHWGFMGEDQLRTCKCQLWGQVYEKNRVQLWFSDELACPVQVVSWNACKMEARTIMILTEYKAGAYPEESFLPPKDYQMRQVESY
jgi:hypothetical protein